MVASSLARAARAVPSTVVNLPPTYTEPVAGSAASAQTWPPVSRGANDVESRPVERSSAIRSVRANRPLPCSTVSNEPPA